MKIENFKLKIVFFGTPSFVIPVLDALQKNFNLVGVVTTPDTIQGRKKILTPTPIKQHCLDQKLSIPVITPEQLTDQTMKQLQELSPDLFITAAYGKFLPEEILSIPKLGSLNIHPSLLPKYRGASPIQTAILNGDTETGVTIIKMDDQLDHGPILIQKTMQLHGKETFESLHTELFQVAAELLPTTIEGWKNGTLKAVPQDESQAVLCKKITKEDGYFSIERPPKPEVLDRMIRAYYPWPTAYTKLPLKHAEVKIVKFLPERRIQVEGGKPMGLKEFLNGYPELQTTMQKLLGSSD